MSMMLHKLNMEVSSERENEEFGLVRTGRGEDLRECLHITPALIRLPRAVPLMVRYCRCLFAKPCGSCDLSSSGEINFIFKITLH